MKIVTLLLRLVSLVFVITVVLPIVLIHLFFYTLFEFLNSFAYHHFLKEEPPQGVIDVFTNINLYHPSLIKFFLMFITPPVKFFLRCKEAVSSIQF